MKLELQKPGTDLFSHLIGILNGIGAGQWFNEIVISSRAGHAKPDRRIFTALCRGMAWTQTTPPI
jgi:FMN phosphatase YigB (HAD superfamily)